MSSILTGSTIRPVENDYVSPRGALQYVRFNSAIPLGAAIVRHTRIAAIKPKTGRSGAMVFVTLDHDIHCGGLTAIRERQHIVYREAAAARVGRTATVPDEANPPEGSTATFTADPVALFRYSALTFNGHRIHYDREHAADEGYPGVVVHGPFLATLLLGHARHQHPDAAIGRFSVRARSPIFDGTLFTLAMHDNRLWIVDSDGKTAITSEVAWA